MSPLQSIPRISSIVMCLALALQAPSITYAADYPVTNAGVWTAPDPDTLAEALQNVADGDSVTLGSNIQIDSGSWYNSGWGPLLFTPGPGKDLTFNLNGKQLNATGGANQNLEVITGSTTKAFTFNGPGTLGSTTSNFGVGVNGLGKLALSNNATLNAGTLQVGGGTAAAPNASILSLNNATLSVNNLSIVNGGTLNGTGTLALTYNNISVTNGGIADFRNFTGFNYNFGAGKTLTVSGGFEHPGLGTPYRSTMEVAPNSDMRVGGSVSVLDGGIIGKTTTLKDINVTGTLEVSGVNSELSEVSAINADGTLTVTGTSGTLNIQDGGVFNTGSAVFNDNAAVTVNGVSTDDNRSTLNITNTGSDSMILADTSDATLNITNGAKVNVGGEAVLGNVDGSKVTLNMGGAGGTDGGYGALTTGGTLTAGNEGDAEVTLSAGSQIISGGATILGAGTNSRVKINLNSGTTQEKFYGWAAGGNAADYTTLAPRGNSSLDVTNGTLRVSGLFAMAGQDVAYGSNYGVATFGAGSELNMQGGSFYNQNIAGTIGEINLKDGAVVSGSGDIYAGELFHITEGTIAAGSRGMYDFNKADDKLTSIGELHIYDRTDKKTEFHGTTFRTELDRGTALNNSDGLSDRAVVHGDLEFDPGFTVDISRALDGKYLLIRTDGGTIDPASFTARELENLNSTLASEKLLLNMNGKLLKGNDRIDRIDLTNGMFTTLENGNKDVWLTVDTTSHGNVKTWWTGNVAGNIWDMTARNFDANQAGNPGNFDGEDQFLDGDIVTFDYSYVAAGGNRTVNVIKDDLANITADDVANYSGDLSSVANVHVAEVRILGGTSSSDRFIWNGGSIFAYDSALYSTLDQGDGQPTPSGRMVKVGDGTLEINNANEFYGGIHLGNDLGTTGGVIDLNNEKGFGTYNSQSGYQNKGLVTVHENTLINIAGTVTAIQNRFIVNEDKILTFNFINDFAIANNNALAAGVDQKSGKGGGVFIGDGGEIQYTGTGNLRLRDNSGTAGGGFYTELAYIFQVPVYIENNKATGKGGGIFAEKFFQLKDGSDIRGNTAQGGGGGIYVGTTSAGLGSIGPKFDIHGNTQIVNNKSVGGNGGGVYVDAGRELVLSTGVSTDTSVIPNVTFNGGDIWFSGNSAKDGPNAIHLANTASDGASHTAAILNVEGPYNTYFYDPISGDTGTQVNINGILATAGNTSHPLAAGQSGTAIFRGDSEFYGSTLVQTGGTFRLENNAIYGRKGTNTFTLNSDSGITGQGSIAAGTIALNGLVDPDTGTFSQPILRDGSGSSSAPASKGILNLNGAVSVANTAEWNLNLVAGSNTTDQIRVTGNAAFTSALETDHNLGLNIDEIVRGKYAIMTATGGITNYSRNKTNRNADIYYDTGSGIVNIGVSSAQSDMTYGRHKATTYVEGTGTNPSTLYLDILGRNRHVTASGGGDWSYDNTWDFDPTNPALDPTTSGTVAWSKNDTGPTTSVYLDGDMVTLTGGSYNLTDPLNPVNPVDLMVTGNVTLSGSGRIRTYSTALAPASPTPGGNTTTITTNLANNDYGIQAYTGKLYKTGAGTTLSFENGTTTAANTFTHGIVIGDTNAGGTIAFQNQYQIAVGTGAYIDFVNDGELHLVSGTVSVANPVVATPIHVADTKTATFNVDPSLTLALTGIISNTSGNGAIAKTGDGILSIGGANTFTGGTTLSGGSLVLNNAAAVGAYNTLIPSAGRVNVTGNNTSTTLNVAGTFRNHFDVSPNQTWTLNAGAAATLGGFTNSANGGAITLGNDSIMNLANAAAVTFTGNVGNGVSNDISMNNSTLNITGAGNSIFNSGIAGTGTITKTLTSTGITEIAANSEFDGTTTINNGTFRVLTGRYFGDSNNSAATSFDLTRTSATQYGVLTGGGTIYADNFNHQGVVAPDRSTALTVAAIDPLRTGTLTVNGNYNVTGTAGTTDYQFEFDLPATATPYPVGTQYDSLKVNGNFNVNGTEKIVFNLHNYTTGDFLLVDVEGGTLNLGSFTGVNGINNPNGAFDTLVHGATETDRHTTEFKTGNQITVNGYVQDANDLWISTQYYNLYMYWTGADIGAAGRIWQQTNNEANDNWLDKAVVSSAETQFEGGDTVYFGDTSVFGVTPANKAISLGSAIVVTDMIVNTNTTYSFAGAYGITTQGTYSGNILDAHYAGGSGSADVPQTLTKQGSGTLTFTNTGGNTFNKGIFINGGTIGFNLTNQLGDGGNGITFTGDGKLQSNASLTLTNTLNINNGVTATLDSVGNAFTVSGKIDETGGTGTGALTKAGTGTVFLTNTNNAWGGTTTIAVGTLQANGAETLGENVAGHEIVDNGTLVVQSTVNEALHQKISGTGIVTKSGAGTLTLDNTNTYDGATNITNGRLIAETIGAINGTNTAAVNMSAGTTLEMKLDGAGESGLLSKSLTGAGSLEKSGTNSTLTINTANTYTGVTTISAGRLTAGIETAPGSNIDTRTVTAASGAELEFALINDGTFNQKIAGAGSLIKSAPGTLALTNANTFTGGTTLSGGSLVLNNAAAVGVYNTSIPSAGRVSVTGNNTSATLNVTNGTFKNHFDVSPNQTWTLNAGVAATLEGFTNSANGGTITLGNDSTMNLANAAAVTFTGNVGNGVSNDISMNNSTLNITGAGNSIFNSGIAGTGTITKNATSTGITEIAADSEFYGTTTISNGNFRVLDGVKFGGASGSTSFTLARNSVTEYGILTGGGTITADNITLQGTAYPDSSLGLTPSSAAEKIGTLHLVGNVNIAKTFVFEYDTATARPVNTITSGFTPSTPPTPPTGDLVSMTGGTSYQIHEPAQIDFNNTVTSGKYLIFLADRDFELFDELGAPTMNVNGINSTGILKKGGTLADASPRGEFRYIWGTTDGNDNNIDDNHPSKIHSQVWLRAKRNTLEMTWEDDYTDSLKHENDIWKTGGANAGGNWKSTQINGGTWERMFNDGDYVIFNGTTADRTIIIGDAIDIDGVVVSGMRVDSGFNYTFNGDGITAVIDPHSAIEGEYIRLTSTPVNPDGKLIKKGTGTLTFANGANTFNEGIEIGDSLNAGGTIAFNRGDQLGVGTGKGIHFINDGTLQSNSDINIGNALTSDLQIDLGKTATLNSNSHLFTVTSKIDETSGSGSANLAKTGTGMVRLTNTANGWNGTTTVAEGTLQAVGVETLGNNANGRTITVQNGAELELEIATADETLHQKITGAGSVEKTGANTLTLDNSTPNSNDYTGGTTITGGKIIAETIDAVGKNVAGGVVTTAAGTTLELKLDNSGVDESGIFHQRITDDGSLIKSGFGTTLTLNRNDNDFKGNTEISGGRIKITDVGAAGNNVATPGIINMSGTNTSFEFALVNSGTFNRKITGVGEVIKSETNTVNLTNANTFSGGTQLNGGTIELANAGALSKTNNTAGSKSGFVFVNENASVIGKGSVNEVQNRFEVANGKTLTLGSDGTSFTISNNGVQSANGGAIQLKGDANFTSNKLIYIKNNTTNQSGGGIYAPNATIMVGGTGLNTVAGISGNTAGQDGGGLYAKAVTVNGGNTISGNTATNGYGGAVYLAGGLNAVSTLNATSGDITFTGNSDSTGANAIYMDQNNTLNLRGNSKINLRDPVSSNSTGINGNVINISMDYNDRETNVVELYGNSKYYGNTEFDRGRLRLNNSARFGATPTSGVNSFRQKAEASLYGNGTIEAKTIDLGGVLSAGKLLPLPRVSEIETLHFIGSTTIGEVPGLGTTKMYIDLNSFMVQKADLIDVTGTLKLAGPGKTLNDLDTSAHGKFLIAQTTAGVLDYTPDGLTFDNRQIISDFDTLMAGQAPNTYRYNIYYTVEDGGKNIYLNVDLTDGSLVWNGLNAPEPDSTTAGDFSYNNKWINDPAYNWEFPVDESKQRFVQKDRVVFDSYTDAKRVPANYLDIRKNIEIQTHVNDTYAPNQAPGALSKAIVRDMVVFGNNARDGQGNLDREEGTYRFTGKGIEGIYDDVWYAAHNEYRGGQLFISEYGTVIFDNEANNFQRGIVIQDGAIGFGNVNQLGTVFENDPENNGVSSNRGITIEGNRSYGTLFINAGNMTLKTPIRIDQADSELIIDTDGNNFGNASITGNNTFTIAHSDIAPPDGQPNGISGLGRLLKEGNGTLRLADENFYEGGTEIYKGTVEVAADNRLGEANGRLILDGGTLRTLDSFTTIRTTILGSNDGIISTDAGTTLTHTGFVTGNGKLTKTSTGTGTGTLILSNDASNFTGNIVIETGRLVADRLGSLGAANFSRTIDVQSELELRTTGTETLRQTLIGGGDLFKTGANNSTVNLVNDTPLFTGRLFAQSGRVHLTGDYGNTDSFRFEAGSILSGYGKLGSTGAGGGVFEAGSILSPRNVIANDPNVIPTAKALTINGALTFTQGSMFDVVITQYDDPTFHPYKMRPVSDLVVVKNGEVAIDPGSQIQVAIDYWADNLTMFDFDENKSDKFTVIDATDGGSVANPYLTFTLNNELLYLPRGVKLQQGWNGLLYQLWFKGNADNVFTNVAETPNQKEVAKAIEDSVYKRDPGLKDLVNILSQDEEITDDMLRDIMSQLAGDLRANALGMAMKMSWRHPFQRVDRDMLPFVSDPCQPISCRIKREHYKREFWGEAYGRYTTSHSDGNSYSHTGTRTGTVIGVDKQFGEYSLTGLAFNYSEPTLKQATGRVTMEDCEIGVYNLTKLTGTVDMKSYFGYSHQWYDLTRHVSIPKGERFDSLFETYRNRTSGDAFSMSVEMLRPVRFYNFIVLSPLMALDYEYAWQKGYREHGGITALEYDNTHLNRFMMRVGVDMKAELRQKLDWFGRIQYAAQLNNNDAPLSSTRFAAATKPTTMNIRGTKIGGSYWNVGLGLEYYFDTKRSMSCFAHYDADFWQHETTHSGNIGLVRRW